jgi:hypothetical protein
MELEAGTPLICASSSISSTLVIKLRPRVAARPPPTSAAATTSSCRGSGPHFPHEAAAVGGHEGTGNPQAETRPRRANGMTARAEGSFSQLVDLARRQPAALILYRKDHLILLATAADFDFAALWGIFCCVLQKLAERLFDKNGIHTHQPNVPRESMLTQWEASRRSFCLSAALTISIGSVHVSCGRTPLALIRAASSRSRISPSSWLAWS